MAGPTTEKPEVNQTEHIELDGDANVKIDGYDSYGLVKSRFDELSIPRTLWVFRRVVLVTLAVYTGYVCEGFELGAGGSVIANRGFIKQFGSEGGEGVRALDPTWVSTWSALLNVGQIVTFTHISWFADRFGRKKSFYLAWLWLVIGCVFLNTAKSPSVWAVWSNTGGIVVAVMMQQLNKAHPDNYLIAMRILWAPVGLMIVFWVFIPESPWFYARHGNKEKALKAMKQLYGGVNGYDFEEEYGIMARTIEHEREVLQERPSFLHVFKGLNKKRTFTVMILAVCQQLAGLAIISTYSTCMLPSTKEKRKMVTETKLIDFFSLAGLNDPFLGTVILSCCNLLAILSWSMSTDKLGRRTIINSCETFVCTVLFIVGALHWTGATSGNAAAGTALLVICCFWTFSHQIIAMSYYLYSAELPSALLRIKTGPVTFFSNSIVGIATCYATPPMLLALSLKTGFVYAALSVPTCILMWLYIPETKGRSAAEIDELYERKIPAWRWSKTITAAEEQMQAVVQVKGSVQVA
ncbi:hypothetical protein K4F52_009956 [Lecanicillium sp. MT-2017a]|nr:hypothetical protein K4F52_009956 [Lecanicillium sp. MT-2017a]